MLLGDTCTRACAFCAVKTGRPAAADMDEPRRVAEAVQHMQLNYVVLTSVNRDDLPDGGAGVFAQTIMQLRQRNPRLGIELLTPDFHRVQAQAVDTIFTALRHAPGEPQLVWGHNMETVPRLYQRVRKGADYNRSLQLLAAVAQQPHCEAKSALMLGLGEQEQEVVAVLDDLRQAGVTRIAIGQYLRPTKYHLAVREYLTPLQFEHYARIAQDLGFTWVKAGAMVRSSYHAEE
jgi:lipoic acid synthetase